MPKIQHYFLPVFLLFSSIYLVAQSSTKGFYKIPAQQFTYYQVIDQDISSTFIQRPRNYFINTGQFSISRQISLSEYKDYVYSQADKKQAQLCPDTSITTPDAYQQYWETSDYNKYPAVGISWENAMAYCHWRTLEEQQDGAYTYYYILPTYELWLAAFNHLDNKRKRHDLNQDYSDWLVDKHVLNSFSFLHNNSPDINNDNRFDEFDTSLYRLTIGASYHQQIEKLMDHKNIRMHKEKGYPDVGFRVVKMPLPASTEQQSELDKMIVELWQLQ